MQEFAIPGAFSAIAAFAEELDAHPYPGGGAVAALVAALAASLAAAAADRSRTGWDEAGGARAQAQALRRRTIELAERDAAAYAAAREALARLARETGIGPDGEDQAARDWQLGTVVERAAGPPLELAASAADIAELSAVIAVRGAADVRADAVVAAILAAAATRAAAQLVQINLVVGEQEPAVMARRYAAAATAAATAAEAG
jgi:formiminotetrahydrofolate cyclodeaminase